MDAKTFSEVRVFSIAIDQFQSHKGNCSRIIAADLEDHSHMAASEAVRAIEVLSLEGHANTGFCSSGIVPQQGRQKMNATQGFG